MSLGLVLGACAFAAVLSALVACIDRWRDARLIAVPRVAPARAVRLTTLPATRKRAA